MGNVTMPPWMQQQLDALNGGSNVPYGQNGPNGGINVQGTIAGAQNSGILPQQGYGRFRTAGPGMPQGAPAPGTPPQSSLPGGGNTNYPVSLPGQVAGNGGQWGAPSTGLLSYGGTSTTPFSSNFGGHTGGGPGSTGDQYAHYLAARPNSLQAQKVNAMPQSFSVQQFNQVAQRNPVLAEAMAAQGGQKFQNAIMSGNGWMQDQMNQFLNQYGSGAQPGFGPDQMALLKSMGIG